MSSIQVQLCDNLPGVCRYVSPTPRPLLLSRVAIHTKSVNGRPSSAMAWEFLTNRATFITIAPFNIVIACCALSSVAGVERSSCFFFCISWSASEVHMLATVGVPSHLLQGEVVTSLFPVVIRCRIGNVHVAATCRTSTRCRRQFPAPVVGNPVDTQAGISGFVYSGR